MATIVGTMNVGGTRYKGKQISVPTPESLAKNTLDATHKSRIKHFKDEKKALGPKKAELAELEKNLAKLKEVDPYTRDYPRITQTEDRIAVLTKEIQYIESGKAELEYYSKAGELLIEFYDNVNMSKGKGKGKKKKMVAAPGKSVYDLFMQPSVSESVQSYIAEQRMLETSSNGDISIKEKDENDDREDKDLKEQTEKGEQGSKDLADDMDVTIDLDPDRSPDVDPETDTEGVIVNSLNPPKLAVQKALTGDNHNVFNKSNKGSNKLTNFVEKKEGFKRADFFDEYLTIIDPHYVMEEDASKEANGDAFCQDCGVYRNINPTDATMICPKCFSYVVIVIDSDKPNYKDPPAEISNFPYRRINHFNECLSQFQAKESTEIPQIVYDTIVMEMKKERLTSMAQLTREKVHTYLKKQANKKFTNYYEHIPHIIHRLSGIQPKTMTPKMEEELRRDFHKIQEPYAKHKPKNRKNFLNYNYVLHKLCQIRAIHDKEYADFLSCFPLLKSRDKLLQQDIVWKKICLDLEWKFIKSV